MSRDFNNNIMLYTKKMVKTFIKNIPLLISKSDQLTSYFIVANKGVIIPSYKRKNINFSAFL